jgi:hypothetical protein
MTDPMPGGRRRIDKVLAEDFLAELENADLAEVRAMRKEAEQEEADLSYLRRMLQGRADILRAEQQRRATGEAADAPSDDRALVERLSAVLADPTRASHGLGRHLSVEPSRVDEHRRHVEQILADVGVSDVRGQSDAELVEALERLQEFERNVSANRRKVQEVMDRCTAEVGRRYTSGQASVDDLLAGS